MFGLRWITAGGLKWHRSPLCAGANAIFRPFLVPHTYGHGFYEPCGRCAA
jgi:hypothetical protein